MKKRIQVPSKKGQALLQKAARHEGLKTRQRTLPARARPIAKGIRANEPVVDRTDNTSTYVSSTRKFQRPTARLLSKIHNALRESKYSELRGLSVCHSEDGLHLYGRVSSFFLKQMAQEAIRPFLLHHAFANHVRVLPKPR